MNNDEKLSTLQSMVGMTVTLVFCGAIIGEVKGKLSYASHYRYTSVNEKTSFRLAAGKNRLAFTVNAVRDIFLFSKEILVTL